MEMKVIFLDIDGVISLEGDYSRPALIDNNIKVPYLWNEEAILALNEVYLKVKETGDLLIVLSSDWRKDWTLRQMRTIFHANKIMCLPSSYTPIGKGYSSDREVAGLIRSMEINDWLKLHKPKNWVAIDDLNLKGIDSSKFVRTDPYKGLTQEGVVDKILGILDKE